jgi:hypothetical protein
MTDREKLRENGLNDDEIDEMSDLGRQLNQGLSARALDKLTQYYLNAGMGDKAVELQSMKSDVVSYIEDLTQAATGVTIWYDDASQMYHELSTGQYITEPEINRNDTDETIANSLIAQYEQFM